VVRTLPLEAWVRLFRNQAVTRRAFSRGETIGSGDVGVARVELNDSDDAGFTSAEECVGMRLRRSLPGGWRLSSRDLERVPAVLRGQRIRVTYRRGAVVAAATVEVKADGWVGDTVPVVNLDSRRGFTALVVGPGELRAVAGS
jgi:flagellar basal body P-ring formation protein FlgA